MERAEEEKKVEIDDVRYQPDLPEDELEKIRRDPIGLWIYSAILKGDYKTGFLKQAVEQNGGAPLHSPELVFRASRDGWYADAFHRACDRRWGRFLLLLRASSKFICGGFSSLPWASEGGPVLDEKALLFSINRERVFKPREAEGAVEHSEDYGPVFGNQSLAVRFNMREGYCSTNGGPTDLFDIPTDWKGNSLLTGEGSRRLPDAKEFSIEELEVFYFE